MDAGAMGERDIFLHLPFILCFDLQFDDNADIVV